MRSAVARGIRMLDACHSASDRIFFHMGRTASPLTCPVLPGGRKNLGTADGFQQQFGRCRLADISRCA